MSYLSCYKLYTWYKPPSTTTANSAFKIEHVLDLQRFFLEFPSYHNHKHANLGKLILLFSRATFNTVIKAIMYRNISIQICKTQRKQIVLWATELTKPSFLWIFVLLLYPITAVIVLITILLSPVTSLITICQILQPDYYHSPYNLLASWGRGSMCWDGCRAVQSYAW